MSPGYVDRGVLASGGLQGQALRAPALRAGERAGEWWAGPAVIRTAKRFPLLKGGMHYGGCHCHARRERGTGKTGHKTPSDTRSVPVPLPMQQSAVKPILSPGSFRYAL